MNKWIWAECFCCLASRENNLKASGHTSSRHSSRFWLFFTWIAFQWTNAYVQRTKNEANRVHEAMQSNRIEFYEAMIHSYDFFLGSSSSPLQWRRQRQYARTHKYIDVVILYTPPKQENRKKKHLFELMANKTQQVNFLLLFAGFHIYLTRNNMLIYLIILHIYYFLCFFWIRLSSSLTLKMEIVGFGGFFTIFLYDKRQSPEDLRRGQMSMSGWMEIRKYSSCTVM